MVLTDNILKHLSTLSKFCPPWPGIQFTKYLLTSTGLPRWWSSLMDSIPHLNSSDKYFTWYMKEALSPHTANIRSWITFGSFLLFMKNVIMDWCSNLKNLCLHTIRLIYAAKWLTSKELSQYYTHKTQRTIPGQEKKANNSMLYPRR
jgi:hypothetical protein